MTRPIASILDVCCLNRPFDDQSQLRIQLETEAILLILQQCETNRWHLISSTAIDAEISQIVDLARQQQVQATLNAAKIKVLENQVLHRRRSELSSFGFSFYDAAHIASAERSRADIFLSTDDRLVRRAKKRAISIYVKIENPLTWLTAVTSSEN